MSRWICILFLFLLLPLVGIAQSPCPIQWGATELIMDCPDTIGVCRMAAHGDTIVLAAGTPYPGGTTTSPTVSVSSNNGVTWSPWHTFWGTNLLDVCAMPVFTSEGVLLCHDTGSAWFRFARTTNLGQSWQEMGTVHDQMRPMTQRGDTIFCSMALDSVIWTADDGLTISPKRFSGFTGAYHAIHDLSATTTHIHAVSITRATESDWPRLNYVRGPLLNGDFDPVVELASDIYYPMDTKIEMDNYGNGVILLEAALDPPPAYPLAMLMYRTADAGMTWQGPDTISNGESAGIFSENVIKDGSRWMVVWWDATRQNDHFNYGGLWCRFSADHGRHWYPTQQIEGDSASVGGLQQVELLGESVRVYAGFQTWYSPELRTQCYLRWEGEIQKDSLPPLITTIRSPDNSHEVGDTVIFAARVTENDTLSEVRLLLNWGDGGVFSYPMIRGNNHEFSFSFQLPEEAQYFYRIEAEDFWENVGNYPDSGWASFHTAHWSAVDSRFIVHPSSFIVSVFPNPVNAATTISFTLPKTVSVELNVFDVTGRLARCLAGGCNPPLQAGTHDITFDGSDLPSGIYFVRMVAAGMVQTQKIVLLK